MIEMNKLAATMLLNMVLKTQNPAIISIVMCINFCSSYVCYVM